MRLKNSSGVAVATAAAMLFGTGLISTAVAGTDAKTHCAGVNACKGQSACKSALPFPTSTAAIVFKCRDVV
jgi:hypothetical protein